MDQWREWPSGEAERLGLAVVGSNRLVDDYNVFAVPRTCMN